MAAAGTAAPTDSIEATERADGRVAVVLFGLVALGGAALGIAADGLGVVTAEGAWRR